jgi:predicted Zn-dependent peptidase
VAKLEKRGDEQHGYSYYVVLAGMPRYEVDIENAIASGEVVVPGRSKNPLAGKNSVADELVKFKKLLDEGALTQQEFETLKKKLLNN